MPHRAVLSDRLRRAAFLAAAVIGVIVAPHTARAETLRLDPPPKASGAEATNAPQPEAEPTDDAVFARMCDAFGEGFTYSPGTGACIKIGGYIKFGTSFGTTSGSAVRSGTGKFELR